MRCRVAAERLEKVGNTVGYQIRLESSRSAATRLLFCTTGVLLRRLQVGCAVTVRTVAATVPRVIDMCQRRRRIAPYAFDCG